MSSLLSPPTASSSSSSTSTPSSLSSPHSSHPFPSHQSRVSRWVGGRQWDVVLSRFQQHYVLHITCMARFGAVLHCQYDAAAQHSDISFLLGSSSNSTSNIVPSLLMRQLAALFQVQKITLFFGMKAMQAATEQQQMDVVRDVMSIVQDINTS